VRRAPSTRICRWFVSRCLTPAGPHLVLVRSLIVSKGATDALDRVITQSLHAQQRARKTIRSVGARTIRCFSRAACRVSCVQAHACSLPVLRSDSTSVSPALCLPTTALQRGNHDCFPRAQVSAAAHLSHGARTIPLLRHGSDRAWTSISALACADYGKRYIHHEFR
jgi:hypothetical protein